MANIGGEKSENLFGFGFAVALHFIVGLGLYFRRFFAFDAGGDHFVLDRYFVTFFKLAAGLCVFVASEFPVVAALFDDDHIILNVDDRSGDLAPSYSRHRWPARSDAPRS